MEEEKKNSHALLLGAGLFLSMTILSSVARQEFAAIFGAAPKENQLTAGSGVFGITPDVLHTPAYFRPEPTLSATAYFVGILGDPVPLMRQREAKPLPPASLTKLLTALLAAEAVDADELIPFSREAKDAGEKITPVKIGERFQRDDVIAFALVSSANDAAYALAEAVGKKEGAFTFDDAIRIFMQKMNQRAQELDLSASAFKNPAGLDADGHTMSAEDIARLLEYIYDHYPHIFEITRNTEKTIQSAGGTEYRIENTNELLGEFPAILASKTGLTDNAKGTLVMLYPVRNTRHSGANKIKRDSENEDGNTRYDRISHGVNPLRNGRTASIVILGSENRFEDGRKIIKWLEEEF
ncbi:MAG: D-alanyl-D-alanine carboxypeptidase (penicillin-binding protein 5/6) [Parcubacteria group bacterium Gr01-1014_33]|nr:MAG: D-alanyl-D-alanine carboxypeptidase (penicillin-binding protein 5/6) [Parcubacteria group bacterium Gr01-1014_33]